MVHIALFPQNTGDVADDDDMMGELPDGIHLLSAEDGSSSTVAMIMEMLSHFYFRQRNHAFDIFFQERVSGDHIMALRVLDYFVTNYAKKQLCYTDEGTVDIHTMYKDMLSSYSKLFFDPFNRSRPCIIKRGDMYVKTSLPQLNFFRFLIRENILPFVRERYSSIEAAMKTHVSKSSRASSSSSTTNTTETSFQDQENGAGQKKSTSSNKMRRFYLQPPASVGQMNLVSSSSSSSTMES